MEPVVNSPFERIRPALTASLVALALILTAVLTPHAARPPLGLAPAHAAALTTHANARHTQDDPQELLGALACMFGLPSVSEHTVLMLEGEQAGTVNGALFDTDTGALVTPIAPLTLLHADPVAFAVPPIDMGNGHVLHSRWKMGIFDLGAPPPTCGQYAVGPITCLDGTCPDSSTFTMVFFAPSAFHPTFIEALEDAVAAREAIERSAGDALPPPPPPSGSGGSIPIVPMPTVSRKDGDPAAFEAQTAACANTPNICDRLICRLQLCRTDAVCSLMEARSEATVIRNATLAAAGVSLAGGTAAAIHYAACGAAKIAILWAVGTRLVFIGTVIYADWKYKRDVRGAETAYLRRLSLCNLTFEMDWKNYLCP